MSATTNPLRRLSLSRDPAARHVLIGLPVLTIAVLGIVDWTIAAERRLRIEAAARGASQVLIARPDDSAALQARLRAAEPALAEIAVAPLTPWCECVGVRMDCATTCGGGLWRYVRVVASVPYARMSPVGPTSISGQYTLRLP